MFLRQQSKTVDFKTHLIKTSSVNNSEKYTEIKSILYSFCRKFHNTECFLKTKYIYNYVKYLGKCNIGYYIIIPIIPIKVRRIFFLS